MLRPVTGVWGYPAGACGLSCGGVWVILWGRVGYPAGACFLLRVRAFLWVYTRAKFVTFQRTPVF